MMMRNPPAAERQTDRNRGCQYSEDRDRKPGIGYERLGIPEIMSVTAAADKI
jgi:hypothetical protein